MTFVTESRAQTVSRSLVVVLRVYLGVVFLLAVSSKFGGDTSFASRLPMILERLGEGSHAFYRSFLHAAVIPNSGAVAAVVVVAELLVAVSLLLGVATRLGATIAMVLTANYMLLKGNWFWSPASNDAAFFVIAAIVAVGAAGRAFGVDHTLARRWPQVPLW
jgi:uncharacterized membrane protein YphA (DoxX/SURF4 family)